MERSLFANRLSSGLSDDLRGDVFRKAPVETQIDPFHVPLLVGGELQFLQAAATVREHPIGLAVALNTMTWDTQSLGPNHATESSARSFSSTAETPPTRIKSTKVEVGKIPRERKLY